MISMLKEFILIWTSYFCQSSVRSSSVNNDKTPLTFYMADKQQTKLITTQKQNWMFFEGQYLIDAILQTHEDGSFYNPSFYS